jgi:hypothetical protein
MLFLWIQRKLLSSEGLRTRFRGKDTMLRMSFLLLLLFSNAKVPYIRVGCTEPHQPEKIKKKDE